MSCPSCGAANDATARFCSTCGAALLVVGDERRVLTVLFADIVGYTTLAEVLDPERVKLLVDRWFNRLVADINEFGGRVDKIVGDAIVALFGAPVAHEDDAERAVRAALRMQQTLHEMATSDEAVGSGDASIRMRIGINTGEVLVGPMRAGGAMTAMGDVVNIASRLQSLAPPGEVLVGRTTRAATSEVILYEPRGLVTTKGREERVEAWAAVEPLLPPGQRPARRKVPLVGRDTELSLLRNAVDSTIDNHRALLVLLVGDAGLGKTRLATEVAQWASAEHGALIAEGRCVPYGEANVWWPVAEALRRACFVETAAPLEEARTRTLDRVSQAFDASSTSAEVERVTSGLLYLMGFEGSLRGIEPSNALEEAVRSVVSFVEASTHFQPVVIQLSDLHWADDLVIEMADTLLERLARRPFVLVATARQGIRERWTPQPGRHNTLVVNLDPLVADAAGQLLESLVGDAPTPELRAALLERGGGNPFYLEELVALISDRMPAGAAASTSPADLRPLPDTLRGLVAARLDGLGVDARSLLADAAVLGRSGDVSALHRMTEGMGQDIDVDAAVAELVAKELFEFDHGLWAFRSDVVREVAYSTLTKLDRARRHIGIASWIEKHKSDTPSDATVDRLAHHFGVAAELVEELRGSVAVPEGVREHALEWIAEAADRAERSEVLPVAARLYTQGLDLIGDEPSPRRLGFLLGRSHVRAESWDLEGAKADAELALAEASETGDETCAARALLALGDVIQKAGETGLAIETLEQAAASFASLGDHQGRGEALRLKGMAEMFGGSLRVAEQTVLEALEAFRSVSARRGEAWALQNLAWISFTTGRTDQADERLQKSVSTFSEIGDTVGMAWALGLLAFVRLQQGRHSEAEALGHSILEEARARSDRWAAGMMQVLLASLDLWSGRTDEALTRSEEASSLFTDIGDPYGLAQALAPRARALVMTGRVDEGLDVYQQAIETGRRMPGPEAVTLMRGALAGAFVQLGQPERALATGALDRVDDVRSPSLGDNEHAVNAALAAMQQGRTGDALELVERAVALGPDGSPRPFLQSARALVFAACGRVDEALDAARAVPPHPAATYLDELVARAAAGLALAGRGDVTGAREWLDAAQARVDATGDRLSQAVARIASSTALAVLGEPDAEAVAADASDRLASIGIDAQGWHEAFALAVGAGADRVG